MYHITNLGNRSNVVQQYADLDGYVPEAGDDHADMTWDSATEWDDDSWADFVSSAIEATESAVESIESFRF